MHLLAQHVRSHRLAVALVTVAIFISAFAISFADIISGTFSFNKSNDVTITQLTIAPPVGLNVGDFLLAQVAVNGGNAAIVTAPVGWTQILRTDNDTNISIISYWKAASNSEPSNYTWTIDHQTTAEGAITRYSGVNIINPIDGAAGNSGFGTEATTTPVTTTGPNVELVALFAADVGKSANAGAYFSPVVGMTEKYDISNTPFGPSAASDDAIQVSAGTTGSKSSTIAGNKKHNWATQLIALRFVTPLSDGLVHYWKFDESSGDAIDAVGSMTLANNNSATFASGKVNNAVNLERDSAQSLKSTADLSESALTAYSVCMWVNPESVPANVLSERNHFLFTSYDSPGLLDMIYLNNGGTRQLWFRQHFPGGEVRTDYDVDLIVGSWYLICGTWNGSQIQLYLNGLAVGTPTPISVIRTDMVDGTFLGSDDPGSAVTNWDGLIDEVGFWTRALSPSEISQLYNGGAGRQYPF